MKLIFAVLDVSLTMVLTRCYKTEGFFTFIRRKYQDQDYLEGDLPVIRYNTQPNKILKDFLSISACLWQLHGDFQSVGKNSTSGKKFDNSMRN